MSKIQRRILLLLLELLVIIAIAVYIASWCFVALTAANTGLVVLGAVGILFTLYIGIVYFHKTGAKILVITEDHFRELHGKKAESEHKAP